MFNVGPMELMMLLVLALIVFGPAKLPELMGSIGHAIREFQKASRELTDVFQETQQEFSSALDLNDLTANESRSSAATDASVQGEDASAPDEVTMTTDVPAEPLATSVPSEYETAAAMLDPIEPLPGDEPATEDAVTPAVVAAEEQPTPRRRTRRRAITDETQDASVVDDSPLASALESASEGGATTQASTSEAALESHSPPVRSRRRRATQDPSEMDADTAEPSEAALQSVDASSNGTMHHETQAPADEDRSPHAETESNDDEPRADAADEGAREQPTPPTRAPRRRARAAVGAADEDGG